MSEQPACTKPITDNWTVSSEPWRINVWGLYRRPRCNCRQIFSQAIGNGHPIFTWLTTATLAEELALNNGPTLTPFKDMINCPVIPPRKMRSYILPVEKAVKVTAIQHLPHKGREVGTILATWIRPIVKSPNLRGHCTLRFGSDEAQVIAPRRATDMISLSCIIITQNQYRNRVGRHRIAISVRKCSRAALRPERSVIYAAGGRRAL